MRTMASAAALAALACAGSLQAHHSGYMFQTTPIWVKGTVVRFEGVNPHTITTVEDKSDGGRVQRWAIEGPGQFQLERMGVEADVPKIGDVIEVCGFPYKEEFSSRARAVDSDGSPLQRIVGHVLVSPDGRKRLWEPHGLLSECIRSSDEPRQSWLDFLNADARAHDVWCDQRRYTVQQSNAPLQAFADEINGLTAMPCK